MIGTSPRKQSLLIKLSNISPISMKHEGSWEGPMTVWENFEGGWTLLISLEGGM